MHKILRFISFGLLNKMKKEENNDNYFNKLVKEDNNINPINFFLIATLAVGVILLFIPAIGLIVDIIYNHTITINLSDLAVYVGACAGIFASGGLTSAWTEYSYSKYNVPIVGEDGRPLTNNNEDTDNDENEEDEQIIINE